METLIDKISYTRYMYKAAKPVLSKIFSKGGTGLSKRRMNKIYKKNTGTTTKGRNARLRKYK